MDGNATHKQLLTPQEPHRPSVWVLALLTVVCVAGLYGALFCYILLQIAIHGFLGTPPGPVDPVFATFTVGGMIACTLGQAAAVYGALRSWRYLLVVEAIGLGVFATIVVLVFPGSS